MTLAETVTNVVLGLDAHGEVRIVAIKGRGTAKQVRTHAIKKTQE